MDKKTLRNLKMQERDSLSAGTLQALSDIITEKVIGLEAFKNAEKLLCYVSCKSEVSTFRLLEYALSLGKTVGVPKVEGDSMIFNRIMSLDELEPGYFGILEPKSRRDTSGETQALKDGILNPEGSFMIVPGLAFDRNLNRIGYGKGFYDRYFGKYFKENYVKCGIAFDFQICEKIEADTNDQPLDMLISENVLIRR